MADLYFLVGLAVALVALAAAVEFIRQGLGAELARLIVPRKDMNPEKPQPRKCPLCGVPFNQRIPDALLTPEEAQAALDELEQGIELATTESAWYSFITLDTVRGALATVAKS